MTTKERNERVDELLHDAGHYEDGADLAQRRGRGALAKKLATLAKTRRTEANRLDPARQAPAWVEDAKSQERLRVANAAG